MADALDAAQRSPVRRARRFFDPRAASGRLIASIVLGFLIAGLCSVLAPRWSGAVDAVSGWVGSGVALLILSWWLILTADGYETHCRAAVEDPGRTVVWATVLVASAFSLVAAGIVMRAARTLHADAERAALVGLSLAAVVVAWFMTHTAYALRYAHLYYRDDDEGVGGLEFPGGQAPDYMDFAYFAFTLGMCFQVSDVVITSRGIRRTSLGHTLLAFMYNTAILALALNLVFSFLS
ncbi:MAG TPA: DUF1345 domain-containing protein [Polyangiaceae bacterium]|jgi:uncharacterized membrane protein|nr:DUF1345 domain-containing protein [Polyangiaceae bacterium]